MANKKEKKLTKKVQEYSTLATGFIVGVNALYILMYAYEFYFSEGGIYTWDVIMFGFFTFVTYFTHSAVLNAMGNDYGYSYYQDIFIINLFTQFAASFSRKGLYIYLLVPGYLLYIVSGFLWSYMSAPKMETEDEQLTDAQRRKLEKKRMKEEKPKVKYVK